MMLKIEVEVGNEALLGAIAIRCSDCFGALNIANALGGDQTEEWKLIRTFSLVELVREARARGLDLGSLVTAVDKRLVNTTPIYQQAEKVLASESGRVSGE